MGMIGDFVIKLVTGTTSPVADGASSLSHKPGDNSVKCSTIIESIAGKEYEVVDRYWNIIGKQLENQITLFRFNGSGVLLARVDCGDHYYEDDDDHCS